MFRPGELRMLRTHCRPMLVFLVAVAAATALAGCGTDHAREMRDERASIFPDNYRAEFVAFMRTYLNDPTNVRDAYIAEPTMKPLVRAINMSCACATTPRTPTAATWEARTAWPCSTAAASTT